MAMPANRPRQRNTEWETRALTLSASERRVRRFRIAVGSGPDSGVEVAATDSGELAIGTAPGNQLVLTDGAVSRRHCAITAAENGFLLRDFGSTNGTYLGGYRIERAHLEPGAIIHVGESALRFDFLDGEAVERLSEATEFEGALGESPAMRRVFAMLERVAPTETTVLFEGETGTGKSALAEAAHRRSARARGPFVTLDCAALPANLIETELFGCARGAYTGADRDRQGILESARGGTVFLDEIGELPLALQPKLLRVLEDRRVTPVGSTKPLALDIRVLAATNRDLCADVNRGAFRADLFYRLSTFRIRVPSLSERAEDVPGLTAHFFRALAPEGGEPPRELIATVMRHRWPGNVRELRSFVERYLVLGDTQPRSEAEPARERFDLTVSFRDAKRVAMAEWERGYVEHLVRTYGGNLTRAGRAVHMDRNHLRKLLAQYALRTRG